MGSSLQSLGAAPASPTPPPATNSPGESASQAGQSNGSARQERFERMLQDASAPQSRARATAAAKATATDAAATSEPTAAPSTPAADPAAKTLEPVADALPLDALIPGWPPSTMGAVVVPPPTASNELATPTSLPGVAGLPTSAVDTALLAAASALPLAASPLATAIAAEAGILPQALLPDLANAAPVLAAQPTPATPTATAATPATLLLPAGGDAVALPLMADFERLLRNESGADAEAPQPFALNSATSSTASTLGLARTSVVNPMDAPSADLHGDDFADTIGSRLTWMAEQKIGHAHIRINPAELGPVEIRMRLDGERVHADFSSGHAEVRQALESSLPKLREMLATQGFALGQTDVGHHGQSRSSGAQQTSSESLDGIRNAAELEAVGTAATRVSIRGLLDAYA